MVDKLEIQVKINSSETITPSKPTPFHLKTYTLSLVDQIHPPYYTVMLLFYPKSSKTSPHLNVNVLKTSLSQTLSQFYPFAGRLNDNFTITCNDQGIHFTETQVNCNLSDFLNSPNKIDLMHNFMPSQDYKTMASSQLLPLLPPLAFQINVFACGSAVLGCYKLHKVLLDGTSLSTFLKYWAAVASKRYDDFVQPNFDAVVSTFPPRLSRDWPSLYFDGGSTCHVVVKSFLFTKDGIRELRTRAASKEVPKPTRFEALAGFVWQQCMAASIVTGAMPSSSNPSSVMAVVVNMRPRLDPPLPNTSMGNFVTTVLVPAGFDVGLRNLVMQIHAAISDVRKRVEAYRGENGTDALVEDVQPMLAYKPGVYAVSSWSQFGLDEVDFGFGKPKWASPTDGLDASTARNLMYFVADASGGGGIEAWLYLEEKEMQVLVSNNQFLAFASLH